MRVADTQVLRTTFECVPLVVLQHLAEIAIVLGAEEPMLYFLCLQLSLSLSLSLSATTAAANQLQYETPSPPSLPLIF